MEKFEKERRESELRYQEQIRVLNANLDDIQAQHKSLTGAKFEAESTIRELRQKYQGLLMESEKIKDELQILRSENKTLDSTKFTNEKEINKYQVRRVCLLRTKSTHNTEF